MSSRLRIRTLSKGCVTADNVSGDVIGNTFNDSNLERRGSYIGYGAIIAGVASLVASGVSAYGASQKGGGPKPGKVNLQGINLSDPSVAQGQYASQSQAIPGMEATASAADLASNQERQQQLTSVDPELMKQIGQIGKLSSSYLNGQIPQDVQDQIQRATAQSSLQGGYGGTGMARNLTARDLGLTSMQLTGQGATLAQTGATMAAEVNPSFTPVSSLLFSPSQIQARNDQMDYYNTDIKNQQSIINSNNQLAAQVYAAAQQKSQNATLGTDAQSAIKTLFGSGTTGTGGSSTSGLLGGIMKMFGGSGSTSSGSSPSDFTLNASDYSGGGGSTVGDFTSSDNSDFASTFGSDLTAGG